MNENRAYPCLASLYASAALVLLFLNILGSVGGEIPLWRTPPLLPFGSVLLFYAANRLLLRKERQLWQLWLCNGLLLGASLLLVAFLPFPDGNAVFLAGCGEAYLLVRAALIAARPATPASSRLHLESLVGWLVLYVWVGSLAGMSGAHLLWLLSACAACLSGVVFYRLSGSVRGTRAAGARGAFVVLLVLALVLLAVLCALLFAAEPLGNGLLWLFEAGGRLLRLLWRLIEQFFAWLDSLLHVRGGYDDSYADTERFQWEPEEVSEADPRAALVFVAVAFAFAAAAALYLLWQLRKRKLGGRAVKASARAGRSSTAFFDALRQAFAALRVRLSFWHALLLHGNTPVGLYLRLARVCRLSRFSRKCGETPRVFLMRLSSLAGSLDDAKTAERLAALAESVDLALYSGAPVFGESVPRAAALYQRTASLVRRACFSRTSADGLRIK